MFAGKWSLKVQVVAVVMMGTTLFLLSNFNAPVGAFAFDKNALPVRVGGVIVYVVPIDSMPDTLRKSLQSLRGKSAFVVVDSGGRLVKDKDIIYQALLTFTVVRSIDDPLNPGWDTKRAEQTARMYQNAANTLRKILIQQSLITLSDEAAQLGARLLVLSVVPQSPFSAEISVVKAFLEPATDPKQIARLIVSSDIIASEATLRLLAYQLKQISSYPIDSSLAPNLLMADMVVLPLSSRALLFRIELEESDPLWTPIKTALEQLRSTLMSNSTSQVVRITSDAYDLGKRIFNLLKQTKGMGSYLRDRERRVQEWYRMLMRYQKMAEDIAIAVRNLP